MVATLEKQTSLDFDSIDPSSWRQCDVLSALSVKSEQRVRDFGEVFTPPHIVKDMLDLFPFEVWEPHPSRTFLEPACGTGNFLIAILDRKMEVIEKRWKEGSLPAGKTKQALKFHSLQAISSIYGVDICYDNVEESIQRMKDCYLYWHKRMAGTNLGKKSREYYVLLWLLQKNIQVANTLADIVPLLAYKWNAKKQTVVVFQSYIGDPSDDGAYIGVERFLNLDMIEA